MRNDHKQMRKVLKIILKIILKYDMIISIEIILKTKEESCQPK